MRFFLLLIFCSSAAVAQELRSYHASAELIEFLLSHRYQEENSDDPFADTSMINKKNLVPEVHQAPARLYLERVKPPVLGNYFASNDRVYNARKLLQKLQCTIHPNGWILYNASKHQLHLYKANQDTVSRLEAIANLHTSLTLQLIESISIKDKSKPAVPPALELGYSKFDPSLFEILYSSITTNTSEDPFAEESDYPNINSIIKYANYREKLTLVHAPEISGVSEKGDLCIDITKQMKEYGVNFQKDGWIILNYTQSKLIYYCTPQSRDLIEVLTRPHQCHRGPSSIEVAARIVTSKASKKAKTYQEVISSDFQVLSSFDIATRSGERSSSNNSIGKSYITEATLGENGYHLELNLSIEAESIHYQSSLFMLTGEPIAILLEQSNGTEATYLLLQSTILRNRTPHTH